VYVVGEVAEPGAHDISSLSTPVECFVQSRWQSRNAGSLRKHTSMSAETIDRGRGCLLNLLLHGVRSEMAHLESGDTLLVAPMGPEVTIEGMVRRPANLRIAE